MKKLESDLSDCVSENKDLKSKVETLKFVIKEKDMKIEEFKSS